MPQTRIRCALARKSARPVSFYKIDRTSVPPSLSMCTYMISRVMARGRMTVIHRSKTACETPSKRPSRERR